MSRFHGEQCWTQIRHQAKRAWRELSDDDLAIMDTVQRERAVRMRDRRSRARRGDLPGDRKSDSWDAYGAAGESRGASRFAHD